MPRRPTVRHPVWTVLWRDAQDAFGSWASLDSVKRDRGDGLVESVGYLVAEDDEDDGWLTLATSCVDTEDAEHFGGGIHIPKPLIVGRRRLS